MEKQGRNGMEILRSALFAVSIAALILAGLMTRTSPAPDGVLILYPLIGAILAVVATRTCPNRHQIASVERLTTLVAACLWLGLIVQSDTVRSYSTMVGNATAQMVLTVVVVSAPVALWWAIERRITTRS